MSEESQRIIDQRWESPKYCFSVGFGPEYPMEDVIFQEVSGIEQDPKEMAYSAENDPAFSMVKMPGLARESCVVLRKGLFKNGSSFWDWYGKIKMNVIVRSDISVKLLDDSGSPILTWILENAWPGKIAVIDPNKDSVEIEVESIEIIHEGLTQH